MTGPTTGEPDWLALRLNRDQDPPTVTLVRNDWAAVTETFTGGFS